ncbi:hypothetical protein GCM10026982_45590 [Nocardiopsis aegyptia]
MGLGDFPSHLERQLIKVLAGAEFSVTLRVTKFLYYPTQGCDYRREALNAIARGELSAFSVEIDYSSGGND